MRTRRCPPHTFTRVRGIALAVAAAAAASCGDGTGPTQKRSGPNLTLDAADAVNDSIGTGGGVLTTTTAGGLTYTLSIPAGALETPVRISLTPVSDQANLPVTGGFGGGVVLEPAGLHFARAVRLTARGLPGAPTGQHLAAVTFEGDGDSLNLSPLFDSTGTAITMVTHFSGASFIFGTTADLETLAEAAAQQGTDPVTASFLARLAALGVPEPPGNPAALPILQQWFADVILPELQNAGTDAELVLAVGDYDNWALEAAAYLTGNLPLVPLGGSPPVPAAVSSEKAQAAAAAAPQLRNAIDGNNAECRAQRSVQALLNALYWQDVARDFGVDTPAESLDRATVVANLCGRIVADDVSLPDPLPTDRSASLDIAWGVLIGSSPPVVPADFDVNVSAVGASIGTPHGFTGAGGGAQQGFFTTVVTANGPAVITATACLVSPGTTTPIPGLCGSTTIDRGSASLPTGTWDGSFGLANTLGGSVLASARMEITGSHVHAFLCFADGSTFTEMINTTVTAPVVPVFRGVQFTAAEARPDTEPIGTFSADSVVLTGTTSHADSVLQLELHDFFQGKEIRNGSGTLLRVDTLARGTAAGSECSMSAPARQRAPVAPASVPGSRLAADPLREAGHP